jgi:rhodanese-related sulfurtransferase
VDFARIIEFAGNHPYLILAFLGTLAALLYSELSSRLGGMKAIGPVEATRLSNRNDAVFLDIREEGEYKAGHIPESIHIPIKQLNDRSNELSKYKSVPVIAYCRSGARSSAVGRILKKRGFETVYNLSGGIMAWQKASLPLSTRK